MLTKPTVWVVGDAMLDVTVESDEFRPSPEDPAAPVLTPTAGTVTFAAGGAANVAMNLAAQGCGVVLWAPWAEGSWATAHLQKLVIGEPGSAVQWQKHVPYGAFLQASGTTTKTRYLRAGRLVARVDDDHDSGAMMPPVMIVGAKPDAVIVTDYGRGAVTMQSATEWADFCVRFKIPMFADPKKGRTGLWKGIPMAAFVLNWDEATELGSSTPYTLIGDDETAKLLAGYLLLRDWCSASRVVVKRGVYGSVIAQLGEGNAATSIEHVPPVQPRHHVADRQGAGDTYIAAMVAGITRGLETPLACRLASAAAGVAVSRPGTSVVSLSAALEACKPFVPADTPVGTLKAMGYVIGYTNGCFDFHLHPGHLSTLKHAASLCDFLYVGVDSDARVKKLKGDNRPVVAAEDRVAQLEAVRGVHKAFVFDDHEAALRSVKPNILCKGADWKEKGVPEAELLKEWGGRLEFAPDVAVPHVTERLKSARIG